MWCKPCDFLLPEQQLACDTQLYERQLRPICPCQGPLERRRCDHKAPHQVWFHLAISFCPNSRLERRRCDHKAAHECGANLAISFYPNSKLACDTQLYERQLRPICPCQITQKFKDSGCALSSTPSSILLSDLSNEHIRSLRKALLRLLLLQYGTRLQHPFV
jgi:hypothetical protein